MFWGLIMEPQRRYSQTVTRSFHVSMAALDISSGDNEPTQVLCTYENRNYLACTLQKGKIIQCPLDLNFSPGDKISFITNGNSTNIVHLTGYITDDFEDIEEEDVLEEEDADESAQKSNKRSLKQADGPAGKKMKTAQLLEALNNQDSDDSDDANFSDVMKAMDEEDDDGEEEEDSDLGEEEESDDEEMDEEEDEDESGDEEEENEAVEVKKKNKLLNGTTPTKKSKQIEQRQQTPAKKTDGTGKTQKQEKVKTPATDKKQKQEQKQDTKGQKSPKENQQSKKRTMEGGVIIEDLKQGEGPIAKPGKICQVYYEGRLRNNNKVFDATNKGPGFKFRLGKQEVIKGWDVGISGMKVGGKRRVVCPAHMAYGQKGSPPTIPPNATLVFDVELKGVQ